MDKIKTYIRRFDDVLKGGIPEGHIVLICGSAGTYKSSLTLNMLTNNTAEDGKKGVYLSLEEPKESLEKTAEGLGLKEWDEEDLLVADIGKLRLSHGTADFAEDWIGIVQDYIESRVDEGYDILVLDSLSALYSLFEFENARREIFQFFGFLRELGITVFLISEVHGEGKSYGEYDEDFLADGIIYLKHFAVSETESQLRIKCVKMRHVPHSKDYFTLMYDNGIFQAARSISQGDGRF